MEITQWITQRASLICRTITLRNTWLKYKETLCYSLGLKESTREGQRWKEIPFPRLGFRSCLRKCSSAHRIAETCAALPRLCWSAVSWQARRSPLECRGGMGNQQLRVWVYRGAEAWWAGGYHAGGRPSKAGFGVARAMEQLSPGQDAGLPRNHIFCVHGWGRALTDFPTPKPFICGPNCRRATFLLQCPPVPSAEKA